MSRISQPFQFGNLTEALRATPIQSGFGAAFTAGASDVMGTPVTLLSALAHDVHYLELVMASTSSSGLNKRVLVDLLIDPAGGTSWAILISALMVAPWNTLDPAPTRYQFPLWIPAGASLGIRGATVDTSTASCFCGARAFGNPSRPDAWWSGQAVESLGFNYTGTTGTGFVASTVTFGSFVNIGVTTSHRYGSLQAGTGGPDSINWSSRGYWAEVGAGGVTLPVGTLVYLTFSQEFLGGKTPQLVTFQDIPKATQLQMRVQAEIGNETLLHTLYGVY